MDFLDGIVFIVLIIPSASNRLDSFQVLQVLFLILSKQTVLCQFWRAYKHGAIDFVSTMGTPWYFGI